MQAVVEVYYRPLVVAEVHTVEDLEQCAPNLTERNRHNARLRIGGLAEEVPSGIGWGLSGGAKIAHDRKPPVVQESAAVLAAEAWGEGALASVFR